MKIQYCIQSMFSGMCGATRIGIIALITLAVLNSYAVCSASSMLDFGQSIKPDKTVLPATGRREAIVDVSACGKYAVVAKSAQGTALQLIDRMAGPGSIFGSAGEVDEGSTVDRHEAAGE